MVGISAGMHVGVDVFSGESVVPEARDRIEQLAERYSIVEVAFDPWPAQPDRPRARRAGRALLSVPATGLQNDPGEQGPAPRDRERRLVLPASEILAQHAADAVARQSRRGWRLDRPSRGAGTNIDAIVALAMALDRLEHQPEAVRRQVGLVDAWSAGP